MTSEWSSEENLIREALGEDEHTLRIRDGDLPPGSSK